MNTSSFVIKFFPEYFKFAFFFPLLGIFAEDEASYSDYEIDWFDPGSSHFALSSDHESRTSASYSFSSIKIREYKRMFPKLPTKFIVPFKMGVVCFETPGDCIFEPIGFFRRHNPCFFFLRSCDLNVENFKTNFIHKSRNFIVW